MTDAEDDLEVIIAERDKLHRLLGLVLAAWCAGVKHTDLRDLRDECREAVWTNQS
jgi:hypothetical protein